MSLLLSSVSLLPSHLFLFDSSFTSIQDSEAVKSILNKSSRRSDRWKLWNASNVTLYTCLFTIGMKKKRQVNLIYWKTGTQLPLYGKREHTVLVHDRMSWIKFVNQKLQAGKSTCITKPDLTGLCYHRCFTLLSLFFRIPFREPCTLPTLFLTHTHTHFSPFDRGAFGCANRGIHVDNAVAARSRARGER